MTAPRPTVHRRFQSAVLFGVNDNNRLMLQVCSDFDVAKREIDSLLDTRSVPMRAGMFGHVEEPGLHDARMWFVSGEKACDKIFEKYFRAFEKASNVRKRPMFERLVLVPIELDVPLVPNDFLEHQDD